LPEVVIICGLTNDGIALIKGLKEKNYPGIIIGGNGLSTPSFLSQCNGTCEGIYLAQAYNYSSQSSLNEAFKNAYSSGLPTQFAAQAFTGIQVILEAVANIPSFEEMSLHDRRDALKKFFLESNYRYSTLLGSFRFDENGDINQENFTIVKVVGNKFVPQ
jgi:ABC-type branched-subunit amino acid transport system substrate-binding protein